MGETLERAFERLLECNYGARLPGLTALQRKQERDCFYAGAFALFGVMMGLTQLSEEAAFPHITRLEAELQAWVEEHPGAANG